MSEEKTPEYEEGSPRQMSPGWLEIVNKLMTHEAAKMIDGPPQVEADDCDTICRRAAQLLRAFRLGEWTAADADCAADLVSDLLDNNAGELADRLILAVEKYRVRRAAMWGDSSCDHE